MPTLGRLSLNLDLAKVDGVHSLEAYKPGRHHHLVATLKLGVHKQKIQHDNGLPLNPLLVAGSEKVKTEHDVNYFPCIEVDGV
jgi:hypothetical protein